jgi:hypothetical protein
MVQLFSTGRLVEWDVRRGCGVIEVASVGSVDAGFGAHGVGVGSKLEVYAGDFLESGLSVGSTVTFKIKYKTHPGQKHFSAGDVSSS